MKRRSPSSHQAQLNRDFIPFMTGETGPAAMSESSRHPFFCHLEEHVRYSEHADAQDDTSNFPLLPQMMWSRKEVRRAFVGSDRAAHAAQVAARWRRCCSKWTWGADLVLYFQNGYEYKGSTKAFYRTFNPEWNDETVVDQEVVDVILSGKVDTSFLDSTGLRLLSILSRPNPTFNLHGETVSFGVACGSLTALSFSSNTWCVITQTHGSLSTSSF